MAPEHSRKAKRRKTLPVDFDFIEADLNWYKDTHAAEATAANQDATGTAPSTVVNTPTLVPETTYPTAETSEDVKPLVEIPSEATSASRDGPTASSTLETVPVTKSRSPSVPLRDVSRTASVSQPDRISEGEPAKLLAKEEPAPESPVMLAPSLTRRSNESNGSTPVESQSAVPHKALSPLAGDALPSPLATKKTKKRKRGPPGLKFLPMPSGEQPPEPMTVDEQPPEPMVVDGIPVLENGLANGRESSMRSASASTSVAAPPVPLPPEPPASAPPKGEASTHPSGMVKEAAAAAESPVPMDIETESDRSAEIVPNGDAPNGIEHDPALSVEARPPSDGHTQTRELPIMAPTELLTNGKAPTPSKESEEGSEVERMLLFIQSASKVSTPTPAVEPPLAVPAVSTPLATNGFAPSTNSTSEFLATHQCACDLIAPRPAAMEITTAPDDQSPFASTSARVLNMVRGASSMTPASRPVVLEFELSADELAQIARWTDRSKTSE